MLGGESYANSPGNAKARQQIYPGSNERTQHGRRPGSLIEKEVAETHGTFSRSSPPGRGLTRWIKVQERHSALQAGRALPDRLHSSRRAARSRLTRTMKAPFGPTLPLTWNYASPAYPTAPLVVWDPPNEGLEVAGADTELRVPSVAQRPQRCAQPRGASDASERSPLRSGDLSSDRRRR
jgi:hypothetical protein